MPAAARFWYFIATLQADLYFIDQLYVQQTSDIRSLTLFFLHRRQTLLDWTP
jgi:hypothetical protein